MAEIQEHAVLVVDDEASIGHAVKRELSLPPLGRYRYIVETFTDPEAALARAREKEFEVVVADYRMPGMDGLAFLKALYAIQPDCMRVMLSGQADMDALTHLINETHLFRFIPKPWESYFLKSTLGQAVEWRAAHLENRRLAEKVRAAGIDLAEGVLGNVDHVLVVDDDAAVANAIVRDLNQGHRNLDSIFSAIRHEAGLGRRSELNSGHLAIEVCTSAEQALKSAESVDFSCVIADYRMPGMDGFEFLAKFVQKQPDCELILLSGAVSMNEVVTALDLLHIRSFIAKPWQAYALRAVVAQALSSRRLHLGNRLLAQMCREAALDFVAD